MGVVWRDSASYSKFFAWACVSDFDGVLTVEVWPWGPVGLRVSSWGENRMLRRWMRAFGETHVVIWFDEEEASGGLRSVKTMSLGMFVLDVRCGILGEGDLCMNLGKVGALLFQLVGLCHGHGLVDVTITTYIRCVVCSLCECL
jgi:hypothetical protein